MKKFFVFFIRLAVIGGAGWLLYNGLLFLNYNKYAVVYSKIFGRINKVYKNDRNFVPAKCIPYTYKIKIYSRKNSFRIKYKTHLSFLDKNFDIVKFDVKISYYLKKNKLLSLSDKFKDDLDIVNNIRYAVEDFLDNAVYDIVNSKRNFKDFIDNCSKNITESIKEKYSKIGIIITNIKVINKEIPLIMNFSKYKKLAIKSIEYEREYKFKLRELELEKLKLRQKAINKVEYLHIIGDYIKENPLILNYLLIEKIKNVNTMVVPLNASGLWFKDNLNNEILKKLMEQENKK